MSVPDFHLGDKAWASIGTTKIKGLNAATVPGVERGTIDIEEFGRDFDFTVPTSAKWTEGSIAGNYVRGDDSGQRALRSKLFDNEGLEDLRIYEDETNFWAPDRGNDPNSVFYVKSNPGPEISKSGVIPFSATLLVQGLLALFDAHVTGSTLSFTATTVTDSADGFVEAGFTEGMTLKIDNSPTSDGATGIITAVTASTLTVSVTEGTMSVEDGTATTTVHGGSL